MAYYDRRTGKRVPPPKGGLEFYTTLMGICFLTNDNSRLLGIIMLVLIWGGIIIRVLGSLSTNNSNASKPTDSKDAVKTSFYNPPPESKNDPKSAFYSPPPKSTNPEKSSSVNMMTDRELDRIYESIYNATPNNGSLDQLIKLFGNEAFHQKVCTSNEFCRMIFHEHISKDLLGYIYEHNKPAAYLICYDIVKAVTQKRN